MDEFKPNSPSFEALKDEMMRLGATRQQADSRAVHYVLAIFAGGAEEEARKKASAVLMSAVTAYEDAAQKYRDAEHECQSKIYWAHCVRKEAEATAERLKEISKEVTDDIKKQKAKLEEMETPEARDQFRKIQFFIKQTKPFLDDGSLSAKACYISGLAALLSGTEVGVQMPDIPPVRQAAPKDDPRKRVPIK